MEERTKDQKLRGKSEKNEKKGEKIRSVEGRLIIIESDKFRKK